MDFLYTVVCFCHHLLAFCLFCSLRMWAMCLAFAVQPPGRDSQHRQPCFSHINQNGNCINHYAFVSGARREWATAFWYTTPFSSSDSALRKHNNVQTLDWMSYINTMLFVLPIPPLYVRPGTRSRVLVWTRAPYAHTIIINREMEISVCFCRIPF